VNTAFIMECPWTSLRRRSRSTILI